VTFAGDCVIDFTQDRAVTVRGDTRYSLEVTALHATKGHTSDGARGWFLQHEKELAAIGLVLLVAVPVPPGRLTAR
jgi:hypothetical protein